mmetsp:Transcript_36967/g.84422  ORF Transcript_36967/g.84422 Transcript_36967/m.84422 type:complete len:84 (-) Transcript_36967:1355-1606(-)
MRAGRGRSRFEGANANGDAACIVDPSTDMLNGGFASRPEPDTGVELLSSSKISCADALEPTEPTVTFLLPPSLLSLFSTTFLT